jgi:hypothetical protein
MQIQNEAKNARTTQEVSVEVIDGMVGVTIKRHLEARVMGQQANVENVVPFVPSEIVEKEQMEANEDVGETSKGDVDQIKMDLERTILMVIDQENIILIVPLSEKENANEDVEPHAHIDGSDITMELHLL